MKLSEKIALLRKQACMTQEALAEKCGISRQSVTKWEQNLSVPELEHLLALSRIFSVSIDELLKDEADFSRVKSVSGCGRHPVQTNLHKRYEGILIKESIEDETILDLMTIHKVELWKTDDTPKYWTALSFSSSTADLPEQLARVMISDPKRGGNWFVDFKAENTKYIVFRGKVLHYTIGSTQEKADVCTACREMGIPENQMNWAES